MKKRFIEDPDRFVLLNPDAIILHKKISKNILDDNISDQKQNSSYLADAFETIKQNYKCKAGTVDDSNKCEPDSDSESSSSNNNHIESYSRVLQSKVPKKFGNQVYLVRMGSEKENNTNIVGNVFVGNDINMLIKKALESSKESGNLIIGRCSKDAFEDDELDKISKNNFITTSKYLGQSFSPVDVVIDTGTSDTIYKRSKDELEKEKNLFDTHELQLNKIEQNTALSNYRNFGYQSINNILRKNYVIEGENKKSALDPTPVYSKEYIDKALKDASLISDAMEPSKENKTLSRVDGAAITATLFPVAGITEELTNYFKKTYEKSSKYPKAEDILFDNIKPPSEKTWNNYLTTKLKDLEFKDPAFLSTSKSESGIKEDLLNSSNELSPYGIPSLLKIEVPKGTRLVDMQERLGIGEGRYKTEKEVLLDKNTIFKIKSVKLEPHDNGIIARIMVRAIQKLPEPIKENSASNNILVYFENDTIRLMDTDYLSDVFETIKLNYNCPDSEKIGSGPGSCGGNTDSKINLNPEIAPADYNSFFENFNKISKDKSEPDRVMRRLNAETVQRRFYRKTEEHFNEIKLENDKKLKEKDEKLWDNLRPEVQSAIKSYTTQDYGVINSALQDGITREEVSLLKEATSKPLGVSTILYRGINFKMPKDIFKVGATWIHKPFASCSTGSFIAEEAASGKLTHITPEEKTILQIFTEPETKGFAVGKNSFHAGADAGSEVILDAGTKFQTIHSEKRGGMRILTVRAINDEQKQDSSYLEDVTNFIKLNYKCPKGTVDDSNKCNPEEQEKSNTSDSKHASETFIGFKADHDFSSPQDVETNKRIQASLDKAAEPLKKFSKNDRHVLTMYSGGRFHQINEYLNGSMKDMENSNDVFDKAIVKESKQLIEKLDKLFTNSDLSEPLVTYRGISNKTLSKYPELVNALDTPGSEIEFPCFSSTSALPFMANNFTTDENGRMGRLLELQLPSGTKALFIAEESGLPNEFEILVNRGTKFKVVETRYTDIIPPNNGSYNDRSAKHVKITTIKAIV